MKRLEISSQTAWQPVAENNLPGFEQIVVTFSTDGEVKIDQLFGFSKTIEGIKYHWKTSDPGFYGGQVARQITHWYPLHFPEPPQIEA